MFSHPKGLFILYDDAVAFASFFSYSAEDWTFWS